jgi:hypothetical protein
MERRGDRHRLDLGHGGRENAEATARHAAIEDLSRRTSDLTLILASVASLVGVGLSLLEMSDTEGLEKAMMIVAVASEFEMVSP